MIGKRVSVRVWLPKFTQNAEINVNVVLTPILTSSLVPGATGQASTPDCAQFPASVTSVLFLPVQSKVPALTVLDKTSSNKQMPVLKTLKLPISLCTFIRFYDQLLKFGLLNIFIDQYFLSLVITGGGDSLTEVYKELFI
jgi:hypothetical protein